MSHLPFTITAYLFNALSVLTNKFLLNKAIPDPLIYIFYISLVSLLAIFALPFTNTPSFETFSLASLSTILWTIGAYFMFKALKIGQVSRVIPIIGSLIPLILLIFASQTNSLSITQTWAVLILVLGMIFLTISDWKGKLNFKELIFEFLSASFFAFSYIILRLAYLKLDFFSVIVWSRLILLPLGLSILAFPNLRRKIITPSGPKLNLLSQTGFIFIVGQISGAISEFLLLFSISLANPALVNSLQGTQYIFLLIFAIILSQKYPQIFEEKYNFKILIPKILGIILIGIGLVILSLY